MTILVLLRLLLLCALDVAKGTWFSFFDTRREDPFATARRSEGEEQKIPALPTPAPTQFARISAWRRHTSDKNIMDVRLSSDEKGIMVSIKFIDRTCNHSTYDTYFLPKEMKDIREQQLGPDEIVVELSGASLQSRLAKSIDFCREYFTHFQVPKSGSYRLRITRLRTDYHALRELDEFPKMDIDIIMDESLGHFDQYIPLPCSESNGYWIYREGVAVNDNIMDEPVYLAKKCLPGGETRGVPANYNSYITVGKSIDEGNRCGMDMRNYNWNRNICSNPTGHHQGDIVHVTDENVTDTRDRTFKMFKDKKILFVGDSHMRGLSEMFLDLVCKFKPSEREQIFNKDTGIIRALPPNLAPLRRACLFIYHINNHKSIHKYLLNFRISTSRNVKN